MTSSKEDRWKRPTHEILKKRSALIHERVKRPTFINRNPPKRPTKETYERDPQRDTNSFRRACKDTYFHQKRPTKEIYKRDCKRDLQESQTPTVECAERPTFIKRDLKKRPTKESNKRDKQKRLTKETHERELQKRPTKETLFSTT